MFILYKFHILRLTPAGPWWQADWNFFTQGRRGGEWDTERDAAGHGFSHYLRGAVVNGITSMAGREVTLRDRSTHWLERIQIHHISLLQFTQINKSVVCNLCHIVVIMKTARLDWSKWQIQYVQNMSGTRQGKSTVVGVSWEHMGR